ncbi:MAG: hypothetical protein JSR28_18915 [Proteobacteria bacterium]|nr:hypothetical protein [Pseudomonadota bacterium]MDE2411493.1 hypothetical protein [Sphingomonadales bacterium]
MTRTVSPRNTALVAILAALALAACGRSGPGASDAATQPGNLAEAGPNGAVGATESALDRAARHNAAQQDDGATGEPELDDNGNPIPQGPNQPTRQEMERAIARAQAQNN